MQNIIRRDHYLKRLVDKKENGLVKVITGIRRCGKSFLLFNLFYDYLIESGVKEDQIISIALDDDTFVQYREPEVLSEYIRSKIINKDMYYILIDEVQYAITKEELKNPENIRLYNVLNGLLRLRNVDIYVTGSNSKMLTKDVLTAFRGRGDEIRVYPISFKEYYSFVGGDKSDAYEEYALYGGMPLVLSKKDDAEKMSYLQTLFTEVYFKDIVERYDIGLPDVLTELTDALCSAVGSLTNVNKIKNTLQTVKNIQVSNTTLSNYLDYLSESFLFSNAKRYDVKGKKYFEYPSKYYCTDIGIRNARLNFRQQEETHIMENIIYNELLCRGYSVDVGVVEITETSAGKKTKKQCEIDFILNRGAKKYYIQSALSVSEQSKLETELRPLKNTKDFFKKILISKTSMKPWTDEDGILHLGLYEFLINEDSLEL
ncbi:ATP-binding protein [Neglecta sp. X4]|uniref:ATP-binding protein n=1 Tax=unclassified Neglectibacter TaxID=2632164 RepID=UPI001369DEC2|nr:MULTISPECIES: ATP-binding protein [unclassified Neglectibacter]NBI19193.1 ATP-binding protein [Neglectibacter sp. 59]NBJ74508.1 ATP-binding protein [Neglectibacter sp. X4]NCE82341.1 ATP-binding protein [Neglectibacter sp. X58]